MSTAYVKASFSPYFNAKPIFICSGKQETFSSIYFLNLF